MTAACTIHDLFPLFQAHRTAVHTELQELQRSGVPVPAPFDAIFLCELVGLVVDLPTGEIVGWVDEDAGPKLAPKAIVERVPVTVAGEVVRG